MMKVILVTGGSGFIGSHFCRLLLSKNKYKVINVDKLTYAANINNYKEELNNLNYTFYQIDICEKDKLEEVFKTNNVDIVVNFAAESHVDNSIINPDIFIKTNVEGTLNLLSLSLKYNVKRFHQISSDEVYGDLSLDSDFKFKENDSLNPSSPYSASKASADLLCLSFNKTYGLYVTISRSSNNYGPNQHEEKFIPLMIKKALNNEKLPIYGDGKNIRNWIYVEDNCEAILKILENGKNGEIYNVCSEDNYSNNEVAKMILKELNQDISLISYIPDRKGHDRKYSIDNSKIKNELGWSTNIDFKEGIINTIKWYIKNY